VRLGPQILELGCGPNKPAGRLGIDRLALPGVDIVANLDEGLPFLEDNSVDEIHANSVLEHVDRLDVLMRDLWRVLKPGGRIHVYVPHFSNPYYYSDYTHRRFFGLYSFEYFSHRQVRFRRKVPSFYQAYAFETEAIALEFASPNRPIHRIKRLVQKVVNAAPRLQEIYEENLCYLIPCYGIQVVLRPVK
jgi:predicted SAM-dependent methyltransferase